MALSSGMAYTSVVIGFLLLSLACGCIVGGGIAMSKLTSGVSSIGLWAIYYAIPGILLLVSGFGRHFSTFAAGIGANVVGTFLALAGVIYAAGVWAGLNTICVPYTGSSIQDKCICSTDLYDRPRSSIFEANCSDLETVRDASAAVTILYVLLLMLSIAGSILGCAAACCESRVPRHRHGMARPPYVIPYRNPKTMMMTRPEERRYFDNDPYTKPTRYGYENPYV